MSVVVLIFFLVVGGALYFLPTIVARNGDRAGPVFVLNLFLGWTLIGWVVAFAIAATSKEIQPMKTCPACAEAVLAAAKICRHCGHALEVLPPAVDPDSLPTVDEIAYGPELNPVAKPVIATDEFMPISWRYVVALIFVDRHCRRHRPEDMARPASAGRRMAAAAGGDGLRHTAAYRRPTSRTQPRWEFSSMAGPGHTPHSLL